MYPLQIRPATEEDLPAVLSLLGQLEEEGAASLPLAQAREVLDRQRHYPDYHIFVATLERKTVGTFALLIMDNLAHDGAPSGVVEDVVVDAGWRGRGIGRRMMQFAMEYCRARGCYKLALSSNMRRTEAHRFYESLGFARHGYSYAVSLRE